MPPAAVRGVVADDLARRTRDPLLPRWLEQLDHIGYCAHPIRLTGQVDQLDMSTGELRTSYTTDHEPDGVLLKACGNRRASRCPSCAAVYRADAWQLIAAGLRGGKGVPDTISGHPRLFVTFTAPSFGAVHSRREQQGRVQPCHPRDHDRRCGHGRSLGCFRRHPPDDPSLGTPLCGRCFDYPAQVLWNAVAPELWRRTRIYLDRALARLAGIPVTELRELVHIEFAKVAEYQARGAIHFHAILRADAAGPELAPPPAWLTAVLLARAVRQAARAVAVLLPATAETPALVARWGEQDDVREITTRGAGTVSAEQVAAYIAKYATKSTSDLAPQLNRRLSDHDLDRLQLPEHLARLVRACWQLGGHRELAGLRLRQWAHTLGFRGHWSTKSRRYSTTFTALRRARIAHATRNRWADGIPLDAWGRRLDEGQVVLVAAWEFAGRGYTTSADAWLAASAAARARERQQIAREERATTAA